MIDFLKWFFSASGIVCVEESEKLSWLRSVKNLLSGGVARRLGGPSAQEYYGWTKLGKTLKRYRCKVCGVHFWGWKKRDICYRFSCYRRRNK